MSNVDSAVKCFNNGFNCTQAILSTYCEQFGLDRETALKLSCPFGAGMGCMAETCGAVTGAFMLIGLKYGKCFEEDTVSKDISYRLVREFTERFKEVNGSISCKELLQCDISTPEGSSNAKSIGLCNRLCPGFVKDSARIIEELLQLT